MWVMLVKCVGKVCWCSGLKVDKGCGCRLGGCVKWEGKVCGCSG